uniref:Uncharacterized protein n=1 Tax=Tetranychus urticae TaxID=32264 RepID=T1KA92_TETUR
MSRRSSRDRYLYCTCEVRCEQDGVEKDKIGKTQRPKKFPWGSITCEGRSKYKPVVDEVTGNVTTTFDVPDSHQLIWAKWMIDERPNGSYGTPVGVCTTTV